MSQRGLSLVELLMALAMGSVLIAGAVTVYLRSSASYAVNETVSGLHEAARFALNTLEPHIRLAGYWGLTGDGARIRGGVGNVALTLDTRGARCGAEFPLDLRRGVDAANNTYALPCAAPGGGAVAEADVLLVRHAEPEPTHASAERLQVYTTLTGVDDRLFMDGHAPGPMTHAEIHDLKAYAYYIARNATGLTGLPALRRKVLQGGSAGPSIGDEEIMPGVEDLQVQFGIDPGIDENGDGLPERYTGIAARYVDPGDPALHTAMTVAVRVWIRVRAERPELGFVDNKTYAYADQHFVPAGDAASYRRLLMSRTFRLRNAGAP